MEAYSIEQTGGMGSKKLIKVFIVIVLNDLDF
jgi:hypothetical protein